MAIRSKYLIQLHKLINIEDLPLLPSELRTDFQKYQQILSLNPYQTYEISSHNLSGKLVNCRALEIDQNQVVYRLVYRVYEVPAPKRILILSFAEHDLAYTKAKERK